MSVQVGDIVRREVLTLKYTTDGKPELMQGRVVYVHPFGRFHTVEFETEGGPIRESFWGCEK